ncbi:MAG: T9SS type A sorting domain-containing protein [Ignavibacteria bacterium]|nr:T9SS type A sorting domain-containing protein [Ignavibacteria bacterium]
MKKIVLICLLLLFSTNLKSQWIQTNGPRGGWVRCLAISGSNLFAGTHGGGVFRSTNNGASWTAVNNGLTNQTIYSLAVSGTNIFAGTADSGVFLSTNNGVNRINKNQGISDVPSAYNYVYAGTEYRSVWHRSLSEIIGIKNISTETPLKYTLSQNYPNPFNPITNVKFSIVNSGQVILIVYDVQGRELQTLVNESLKPGTYATTIDGSMLTSGVYFYRLTAGEYSETKRMVLIK